MTDAPEPPAEPYAIDDRVRVRLADDDAESPFEGAVCRVVHVFVDEPETGAGPNGEDEPERETARAAYRLEEMESGKTLPVVVRHRDLRPVADAA